MTKKEEETKNKLTWRLANLPTAAEVADLVNAGVLDREEARQILIKEETPMSRDDEIAALKDMVNTLQETVKELLARPATNTYIPFHREIVVQPRYAPYWDRVFMANSSLGGTLSRGTSTGTSNVTYSLSSNTGNIV